MKSSYKTGLVCLFLLIAVWCASVQISAENGENDIALTATEIVPNCSVSDTLSSGSDVDFYSFSLDQRGVVELNFWVDGAYNSGVAWMVRLLDCNEQVIFEKSVKGSSQGAIYTSPKIGLAAETYYIEVRKSVMWGYSSLEYSFSVDYTQSNCWEQERNDMFDSSNAIELGVSYHGLLSSYNDVDIYSFRLSESLQGALVFLPESNAIPTVGWRLRLYDESKTNVVYSATGMGRIEILMSSYVQLEETYFLEISSADSMECDGFEYTITIGVAAHICDLEDVEAKAPTCLVAGNIAYRICGECGKKFDLHGDEIDLVAIAATGHITENVTPTVLVVPTCTESGEQMIRCAADGCGAEMHSEIPALGHHMSVDWSVDTDSTCTSAGKQSRHCLNENCGYFEDQRDMPLAEHDYQITVALQETCVTGGVIIKTCKDCGYREDEAVQATGQHLFGEWVTVRDSTCTVKGEKRQACKVCTVENILELDLLPHVYSSEWTIDVTPSCTTGGSRSYHCVLCDHQKDIEAIDAFGHDLSDQYTIDQQPSCEVAGRKSKHCSRCDLTTDTVELAPLSHNFGTVFVTDIAATCENDGRESKHCSRCEAVIEARAIPAIGHSLGAWRVIEEASCTNKEKRERSCITCQKAETVEFGELLDHVFLPTFTVDIAATCEGDGVKSRHCGKCGERTDVTVIASTDHAYDAGSVAVKPTAKSAGTMVFTCGNCGETYSESIEKLEMERNAVWIAGIFLALVAVGGLTVILILKARGKRAADMTKNDDTSQAEASTVSEEHSRQDT